MEDRTINDITALEVIERIIDRCPTQQTKADAKDILAGFLAACEGFTMPSGQTELYREGYRTGSADKPLELRMTAMVYAMACTVDQAIEDHETMSGYKAEKQYN